ncbi:3-oxoacyl-acyl carrier protein reductase [Thermoplasma volcanium GSS1]|uniref:3-oxoacyl-acyl carrier protein reductase n=1 Tax=Thermoplasma volcanium (strain ATCC 51530 / DSM 4299 / JCM 9571 / NBRC 15438 / GSS1) TaxID=273116 RepID=Q979S4_THEVO|nr:SDR family oxidoreductase [Thermoplasma volcanium]BAB60228.1 3-oxoacyl-acyl carrier protein reductase [Thermoplasma volcanium GSS1]
MATERVLIAGTGENLGYFTALNLLKSGFKVSIIARNKEKLENMGSELRKYGDIEYFAVDLSKREGLASLKKHFSSLNYQIKGVVVEVGGYASDSLDSITAFDQMIEANLKIPILVLSAISGMLDKGSSIVFITSVFASRKIAESSVSYSLSKAGLNRLVEISAKILRQKGIRVNGISTSIISQKPHDKDKIEWQPGTQNVDPELISNVVVFLMSDLSLGVTGNIIYVDKGSSL